MGPYQYGLLLPQRAPGAGGHNLHWLGERTLGVEVTEAELAAGCGLGNIDPQHLGGNRDIAAIDFALTWPLPPAGSKLVTIRADADAIGAMAVLGLRGAGMTLTEETIERIALVSEADRFARGRWPGTRPLPAAAADVDEVGPGRQNLGAMIAGIALPELAPEAAVREMRRWLLSGKAPDSWIRLAETAAGRLFSALESGAVRVRAIAPGKMALVEGFVPGALRLGYRLAPVVIAVATLQGAPDRRPQRKITIAQYEPGHVDLEPAARALSEIEPGWGGSATIIGSPQGQCCTMPIKYCAGILRRHETRR